MMGIASHLYSWMQLLWTSRCTITKQWIIPWWSPLYPLITIMVFKANHNIILLVLDGFLNIFHQVSFLQVLLLIRQMEHSNTQSVWVYSWHALRITIIICMDIILGHFFYKWTTGQWLYRFVNFMLMCYRTDLPLSGGCQSFNFNDWPTGYHGCLSLPYTSDGRNSSW